MTTTDDFVYFPSSLNCIVAIEWIATTTFILDRVDRNKFFKILFKKRWESSITFILNMRWRSYDRQCVPVEVLDCH